MAKFKKPKLSKKLLLSALAVLVLAAGGFAAYKWVWGDKPAAEAEPEAVAKSLLDDLQQSLTSDTSESLRDRAVRDLELKADFPDKLSKEEQFGVFSDLAVAKARDNDRAAVEYAKKALEVMPTDDEFKANYQGLIDRLNAIAGGKLDAAE